MTDDLYQVPLERFTSARDALAGKLKASGDKAAAAEVKRLRKPSLPAWAVNQVVWQARDSWDRLHAAAQALRQLQEQGAAPDDLRKATREQREALQECETHASELLAAHGHTVSPAVLQKVSHTLLALAYEASGETPGRLDQDLPAPGFDALAGLTIAPPVARPATPPKATGEELPLTRGVEAGDVEAERARERQVKVAAEARLTEARRALAAASNRLAEAEALRVSLERQLEAARRASDDARRGVAAAEDEVKAAEASPQRTK